MVETRNQKRKNHERISQEEQRKRRKLNEEEIAALLNTSEDVENDTRRSSNSPVNGQTGFRGFDRVEKKMKQAGPTHSEPGCSNWQNVHQADESDDSETGLSETIAETSADTLIDDEPSKPSKKCQKAISSEERYIRPFRGPCRRRGPKPRKTNYQKYLEAKEKQRRRATRHLRKRRNALSKSFRPPIHPRTAPVAQGSTHEEPASNNHPTDDSQATDHHVADDPPSPLHRQTDESPLPPLPLVAAAMAAAAALTLAAAAAAAAAAATPPPLPPPPPPPPVDLLPPPPSPSVIMARVPPPPPPAIMALLPPPPLPQFLLGLSVDPPSQGELPPPPPPLEEHHNVDVAAPPAPRYQGEANGHRRQAIFTEGQRPERIAGERGALTYRQWQEAANDHRMWRGEQNNNGDHYNDGTYHYYHHDNDYNHNYDNGNYQNRNGNRRYHNNDHENRNNNYRQSNYYYYYNQNTYNHYETYSNCHVVSGDRISYDTHTFPK